MLVTGDPSASRLSPDLAIARDIPDAIRQLARRPFDVLLLDEHLPRSPVDRLLETAKAYWTWMQVVLLVEDAAARERVAARERGARVAPPPRSPHELLELVARGAAADAEPTAQPDEAPLSLEEVERRQILAALDRHRGNRVATANELGISVRKLYYRLRQYQREGLATHSRAG